MTKRVEVQGGGAVGCWRSARLALDQMVNRKYETSDNYRHHNRPFIMCIPFSCLFFFPSHLIIQVVYAV